MLVLIFQADLVIHILLFNVQAAAAAATDIFLPTLAAQVLQRLEQLLQEALEVLRLLERQAHLVKVAAEAEALVQAMYGQVLLAALA
jgi:hypothetical protein